MEIEGARVRMGTAEILKMAVRIGGWTCLLVILTILFLSVIEQEEPINALADIEPRRSLFSLLFLIMTGMILELVTSTGSWARISSTKFRDLTDESEDYHAENLSKEVLQSIAACSQRTATSVRNRALIVLVHCGGLRVSQCLSLLPEDVDEGARTIRVFCDEDSTAKTIRLNAAAFLFIESWLEVRRQKGINGSAPIICTMDGKPISRSYGRRLFHRSARKPENGKAGFSSPQIEKFRDPSHVMRESYSAPSSVTQARRARLFSFES